MRSVSRSRCAYLFCVAIYCLMVGAVQADSSLLSNLHDPKEMLSSAQLDELQAKANAGDWEIKQQFAIAYLFEYLSFFSREQGCKTLHYGLFCYQLAERHKAGQKFLQEIVELESSGPINPAVLAEFQAQYASYWIMAAKLEDYAPETDACKKTLRYYQKAIESESVAHPTWSCSARRMASIASLGICMDESSTKAKEYYLKSGSCPSY